MSICIVKGTDPMLKRAFSVKNVLMSGLMILVFISNQLVITNVQTVDIPACPSADQFPKPGCFDKKENTAKEKPDNKVTKRKEKKK